MTRDVIGEIMEKQELIAKLDDLPMEDWLEVVGTAADSRYRGLRQTNSNAATFHSIFRECSRLRKILKRIKI